MKLKQREDWIVKYLIDQGNSASVDVLNRDFVEDYVEATGAKYYIQMYGANTCRRLGKDLAAMNKSGILKRSRTGIYGMVGMGFPRWVWSYRLREIK